MIESFPGGWENYDHQSGPALVERAQERVKAGPGQFKKRLKIGGIDLTEQLVSCDVNFNEDGESGMTLEVGYPLNRTEMERARTELWIGYGDRLIPYFRGKLFEPKDSPSGLFSSATAYGLATQLGQRHMRGRVSYAGWDLREAFWDLIDRFGADKDRFFFDGEHSQILDGEESESGGLPDFGLEVSMREVETAILEQMSFGAFDIPGGMHVVQKLPRIDAAERRNLNHIWRDQHYLQDGFEFSQPSRNFFSRVVVFRRNEEFGGGGAPTPEGSGMVPDGEGGWFPNTMDGSEADTRRNTSWRPDRDWRSEYAVYAEKSVSNSGMFNVHEGRADIVPDYPGQQEHAVREAEWRANAYSAGVGPFTFNCPPCDFGLHDVFGVERIEEVREHLGPTGFRQLVNSALGRLDSVLYSCIVRGINLHIDNTGETMQVTGDGAVRDRSVVRPGGSLTPIRLGVSPGVVAA